MDITITGLDNLQAMQLSSSVRIRMMHSVDTGLEVAYDDEKMAIIESLASLHEHLCNGLIEAGINEELLLTDMHSVSRLMVTYQDHKGEL